MPMECLCWVNAFVPYNNTNNTEIAARAILLLAEPTVINSQVTDWYQMADMSSRTQANGWLMAQTLAHRTQTHIICRHSQ